MVIKIENFVRNKAEHFGLFCFYVFLTGITYLAFDKTTLAIQQGLLFLFFTSTPDRGITSPRNQRWFWYSLLACIAFAVFLNQKTFKLEYGLLHPSSIEKQEQEYIPKAIASKFQSHYQELNTPDAKCDQTAKMPWGSEASCYENISIKKIYSSEFRAADSDIFGQNQWSAIKNAITPLLDNNSAWHFYYQNKNKSPYSVFSRFEVTEAMVGGRICLKGLFLFEDGNPSPQVPPDGSCSILTNQDVGRVYWGFSANAKDELVVGYSPRNSLRIVFSKALVFLVMCAAFIAWFDIKKTRLSYITLFALGAATALLGKFDYLSGIKTALGYRDSLLYITWGKEISDYFLKWDLLNALRGGESVYLFMPGLRYLRAFEFLIFGETGALYKTMILFVPALAYAVVTIIAKQSKTTGFAFTILSLTAFIRVLRTANDGYPDPAGLWFMLVAAILLLRSIQKQTDDMASISWSAVLGFFMISASIWMRPNFLFAAIFASSYWVAMDIKNIWKKIAETSPLLLVFLMTLHNLYFGDRFVLLTDAATLSDTFAVSPMAYFKAFSELASLSCGDNCHKVFSRLYSMWFPAGWVLFFVPILILCFVKHWRSGLWFVALLAFSLQLPHLFFVSSGRHTMAADYFSSICVVAGFYWGLVWVRSFIRMGHEAKNL